MVPFIVGEIHEQESWRESAFSSSVGEIFSEADKGYSEKVSKFQALLPPHQHFVTYSPSNRQKIIYR